MRVEHDLQLGRAASNETPGDLALRVEAAGRVVEDLPIEAGLYAVPGQLPDDRVQIDLADSTREGGPRRPLVRT